MAQSDRVTSQLIDKVSQQIMESLNSSISTLVVQAVQSCLPTVIKAAVESALPAAIQKVMQPINERFQKIEERLLAFENSSHAERVDERTVHATTTSTTSYATAVKTMPIDATLSSTAEKLSVTPGVLTGRGEDIGIPRNYHIVIRKIPDETMYNEEWLKHSIEGKLPSGATITEVIRLKSRDAERVRRSHTGTFKVIINYRGYATDLYKPEIFPRNAEVKRYRFLREAKALMSTSKTVFLQN